MARLRTFVGIQVDDKIRSAAEQVIRRLSPLVQQVRWVRPENIHLTLKFLGEVQDRELHDVCTATRMAAEKTKRFPLLCQSLGAFPNVENPGTIWIGINDENEILAPLQKRLEVLLCDRLGVPMERRPYRGHLTLGRIRSKQDVDPDLIAAMRDMADDEFGLLKVEELVVYSSELGRSGPTYTVIGRCPLDK